MEENNIPYQDLNVAEDKDARNDMIKKSGQMGVPVIDVYDKILVGYNESKLKEALNI